MGYTGKQVIHPDQIPIVQEAFLPQPNQIEWAKNLLAAFEDHQQSGKVSELYRNKFALPLFLFTFKFLFFRELLFLEEA